jgi:DUF1009 family protein
MSAPAPSAIAASEGPLAIICGGGSMPEAVAQAALREGREVLLFPIAGSADPAMAARYPHHWIKIGQAGRWLRLVRAAGCRDVVWIGALVRPSFREIRPDFYALRMMPRLFKVYWGGDDLLLTGLAEMFEEHGFRLLGAHQVAPEILAPEGVLGARQPTVDDRIDIARALELLRATGPFDIGQAVVVAGHRVLAIEAAEGTDRMLEHVAHLRADGRIRTAVGTGVLVKAPKDSQDHRFDLPTIGPRTIDGIVRAGLSGLAVVAGSTIVAEPEQLIAAAEKAGVFVVGVRALAAEPAA